jgi:cytolysin-activating lysine-acyltransferase
LKEALAGFGAATSANGGTATGAAAPKTVAQVLGEITWLMTQSPRHKAIPLGDLEWLVMPALLLRQFRIFYQGEQPVGVALWALVDDLVAKRIDAGDSRLSAVEWKSGTAMRIVEMVAPFGGEAEMCAQLGSA